MASLEELLAAEKTKRDALLDTTVLELDPGAFTEQQLGLRPVMVDGIGRLWDVGSKPWKVVYDPRWSEK